MSGFSNDEGTSDNQVIVIVGTATSQQALDSVDSYPKRLFTPVQINDEHTVNMKIDTGTDTCLLTVDDLQALNLSLDIQPCSAVLKGYGGQQINSLGTTTLKVQNVASVGSGYQH